MWFFSLSWNNMTYCQHALGSSCNRVMYHDQITCNHSVSCTLVAIQANWIGKRILFDEFFKANFKLRLKISLFIFCSRHLSTPFERCYMSKAYMIISKFSFKSTKREIFYGNLYRYGNDNQMINIPYEHLHLRVRCFVSFISSFRLALVFQINALNSFLAACLLCEYSLWHRLCVCVSNSTNWK